MARRRTLRNALVLLAIGLLLLFASGCDSQASPESGFSAASVTTLATEAPAISDAEPVSGQPSDVDPSGVESIRDIDFRNGFSYDIRLDLEGGPEIVAVENGRVEVGQPGDPNYLQFFVGTIAYGDIDGNGNEEAAVKTTWNGGGSGFFDSVRVYRLINGQPVLVDALSYGDRAFGGVHDLAVLDGVLNVLVFTDGEGACCPNAMSEVSVELSDATLTEIATTEAVRWMALDDAEAPPALEFLPTTNSALLTVRPDATKAPVFFDAGAGQRVTRAIVSGPSPDAVTIWNERTGEQIEFDEEAVLPEAGLYELRVSFAAGRDAGTTMRLSIVGAR